MLQGSLLCVRACDILLRLSTKTLSNELHLSHHHCMIFTFSAIAGQ